MDLQNLAYALVQVVHNFGAAAVVGSALFALWPARQTLVVRGRLARVALLGWAAQGASGAAFGAISLSFYGQLPDIHGIAVAALGIKMLCAISGFVLSAVYIARSHGWSDASRDRAWTVLVLLAATALTTAAFLRWYS